jgi:hypothetical protein
MSRYDATMVFRCSKSLKKELDAWAKKNHTSPGDMARKVLVTALGLEEDQRWRLPPGIKPTRSVQARNRPAR